MAPRTDLEPSFKTNVLSVQLVTSHFFPLLQKGSLKKIVNVSSTVGSFSMSRAFSFMPAPAYKITKAALNMLTYQYALTYAEEGFTIIAVSPGVSSPYADHR
jgi:NAD(P)-dependent dehydrogenase (short-subunit alcohol dehydrogenase family)